MQFEWFAVYFFILNLCGFLSMYIDKKRAVKHKWRISEKTLFLIAVLGGSAGAILGMRCFRHKTKHWRFVVGMPAILAAQLALLFFLLRFFHVI